MGIKQRQKEQRKKYKGFYKTFYSGNKCYYCGQPSDTVDHVPAISVATNIGLDEIEKKGIKMIKVSSCRECNLILGNKPVNTLDDRARFIYNRLQSRYKRLLASEEWLDSELDELDGSLRSYIVSHVNMQFWVERRLQYMEDLFYDVL